MLEQSYGRELPPPPFALEQPPVPESLVRFPLTNLRGMRVPDASETFPNIINEEDSTVAKIVTLLMSMKMSVHLYIDRNDRE